MMAHPPKIKKDRNISLLKSGLWDGKFGPTVRKTPFDIHIAVSDIASHLFLSTVPYYIAV